MNKRYDGILLCSDLDGTLMSDGGKVSKENCAAIANFKSQGGLFTASTGRTGEFLDEFSRYFTCNAPIVAFNGTARYDAHTHCYSDVTYLSPLLNEMYERLAEVWLPELRHISVCELRLRQEFEPYRGEEFLKAVRAASPVKVVMVGSTPEQTVAVREWLKQQPHADLCFFCRSWDTGLEIIPATATKGHAVLKLKKALPWIDKLVCVGDYENDITMIEAADIGVAVANAVPEVKAVADVQLTATNRQSAIAELISML